MKETYFCIWQKIEGEDKSGGKSGSVGSKYGCFPTVVFEMAYSESLLQVSEDCAFILGHAGGQVRLAVAINIPYGKPGERGSAHGTTIDYREVTKVGFLDDRGGPKDTPVLQESDAQGNPTKFYLDLVDNKGRLRSVITRTESHRVCMFSSSVLWAPIQIILMYLLALRRRCGR